MNWKLEHVFSAHSGGLYALAPGRDARSFFSAGADKVVAEWTLGNTQPNAFAIRTERVVYSLLNIAREQLVIGTGAGAMHVIDLKARKEMRHLQFHAKGIFHMARLESQHTVVACCADGSASVWDARDWSLQRHLYLSTEKIRRVALNRDASLAAFACGDGAVRLFDTHTWQPVHSLTAHSAAATSVAFLADGTLLSGGKDAHLCLWDTASMKMMERIPAHNYAIYDIVPLGTSGLFATASRDKTVKIWNPADLSSPLRLDRKTHRGHIHSVNAALWLDEAQTLLSCSDDRGIIAWRETA